MNKINDFIIVLIGFILIIPLFDFTNIVYILPEIFFLIISMIFKDKSYALVKVSKKRIFQSFCLNCFFIIIFLAMLYLFNITLNFNILACLIFIIVIQNTHFQSIGNYFVKLRIINKTLKDKIKILIWNFCKISIIYFTIILNHFMFDEVLIKRILEFLLLLYVVNITSFFIMEDKSLLMKVLNITYENDKK